MIIENFRYISSYFALKIVKDCTHFFDVAFNFVGTNLERYLSNRR
jgi:hypothetical protein